MALNKLKLTELRGIPEAERAEILAAFSAARKDSPNGEMEFLDERIAEFENQYEMDSETMVDRLGRHELKETADVCKWLILLDTKRSLERQAAETRTD